MQCKKLVLEFRLFLQQTAERVSVIANPIIATSTRSCAVRVYLKVVVIFINTLSAQCDMHQKGWMKRNQQHGGGVINHDLPGQSHYWSHTF